MANSNDKADKGQQALEVKPLRSLAPMFPTPPGYHATTQSAVPPVVFVTPVGPNSSSANPPLASASSSQCFPQPTTPVEAIPISIAPSVLKYDEDESLDGYEDPFSPLQNPSSLKRARRTKQSQDSAAFKAKRIRPIRRSLNKELGFWPSSLQDPRESAEAIMMTYDALRRRMLQLDEKEDGCRRADLKAGTFMMKNDLRINKHKRIGPVPGIEIRDLFYFRFELCLVGLHAQMMGGIDYMSAKYRGIDDESVAVCILSSGGYENDDDDPNVLIYTGQGGNSRHKEKHDQKLERGNLALQNSTNRKNQIRVVRSAHDPFCHFSKIYIYDGLYRIEDSWMDKAKNGFNVFKYKLRREPGQADGIAVWKMTEKWKENPAMREKVILPDLSLGAEKMPVRLVNDVDGERRPKHFTYVTSVKYLRPLTSEKPLQGCKCPTVCLPGDTGCSCAQRNGGDLPYSSGGLLVKRVPMLYECSSACGCSNNCRNRITQKGIRLNFEVFWTGERGWGLRSWDPIRAGTFVCEYAGEVIDETALNTGDEEDDYVFRASPPAENVLRWNFGAELLEEASADTTADSHKPLPIIINAKNSGNVARFLNHSCSPNLLWQSVHHDHGDEGYPHIMFFAMKHIPPMTELTYDYGTSEADSGKKGESSKACRPRQCLCGSPKCRSFGCS